MPIIASNAYIIGLLIIVTIFSGYADSKGFIHASLIWEDGKIVTREVLKSGIGFALGILSYWIALKLLQSLQIATSPEVQTLGWFVVTIIGVAISSGSFFSWDIIDKTVSVLIIFGFSWLLTRGH